MIIGLPKEIISDEHRVGIIPGGVEQLVKDGNEVIVQKDAGTESGFTDEEYSSAGAKIIDNAKDLFRDAELIVKVKEPQPEECDMISEGQLIFTYFHFAANRELTESFIKNKAIAIAYETVQLKDKTLPLLVPMSEVAGRMAVQEGAKFLEAPSGGIGVLLGGVPGVDPATVTILGGGIVGSNAARIAAGMGAKVYILDINLDRLRYLEDVMPDNVITLMSNPSNIRKLLKFTDLLIGAVLIPGAKAPKLVTKEMLSLMKKGSVIVDVAVDQGGCIETCKPTTHDNPTFIIDGVVHYCVANMPGAVPYTSTIALTNATLPYIMILANNGFSDSFDEYEDLKLGLNIYKGKITHKGVADAFGLEYVPIDKALAT